MNPTAEDGPLHAIVPLNVLKKSKARLSPILRPSERAQLSLEMLRNVLSAVRGSNKIASVTVVSADKGVRTVVQRLGVDFLWEGKRRGLNKALRLAIARSARRGARAVVILHADLPLLTCQEVDRFLSMSRGHDVVLVPSKDGFGTNVLLLKPLEIIRPAFGKDSLRRHLSSAHKKRLRSQVLRIRGLSYDLDKPKDLFRLMREHPRNETARFLRTLLAEPKCAGKRKALGVRQTKRQYCKCKGI